MYKYDSKTRKVIPYTPPVKDGNYTVYCDNMDDVINCAQCGKEITFGEGYSSIEIFSGPWSHLVCDDCKEKEYERAHIR